MKLCIVQNAFDPSPRAWLDPPPRALPSSIRTATLDLLNTDIPRVERVRCDLGSAIGASLPTWTGAISHLHGQRWVARVSQHNVRRRQSVIWFGEEER